MLAVWTSVKLEETEESTGAQSLEKGVSFSLKPRVPSPILFEILEIERLVVGVSGESPVDCMTCITDGDLVYQRVDHQVNRGRYDQREHCVERFIL